MKTKTQFAAWPGCGWLFRNGGPSSHPLVQGVLGITDKWELQVRGHYDPEEDQYELQCHQFGGAWEPIGEPFVLVETEEGRREGTLKLGHREYRVIATKTQTREGRNTIKLRLPQIQATSGPLY